MHKLPWLGLIHSYKALPLPPPRSTKGRQGPPWCRAREVQEGLGQEEQVSELATLGSPER